MDISEFALPPSKKRRFFNEPSLVHDTSLDPNPALPDEVDALPESTYTNGHNETALDGTPINNGHANGDGIDTSRISTKRENEEKFDVSMFEGVVGEQVSSAILQTLRDAAGEDTERGWSQVRVFLCKLHELTVKPSY